MKLLRITAVAVIVLVVASTLVGCFGSASDAKDDALHSVVPDVLGKTQADATVVLTEAGYLVGEVSASAGAGSKPGTVASQDPVAGTSVPRETAVDLVIVQ